jgi:muramidase (phage lysozyme)
MARLSWTAVDSNERAARNVLAGCDAIAHCEGTWHVRDDGYNVLVGYGTFNDYSQHPNRRVEFRKGEFSTAAGRYQFLNRTWRELADKLMLADFSPTSQDRACIELFRECNALEDLKKGLVGVWAAKCKSVWASLPGAGYGQPERTRGQVVSYFRQSGGELYSFSNVQGGAA